MKGSKNRRGLKTNLCLLRMKQYPSEPPLWGNGCPWPLVGTATRLRAEPPRIRGSISGMDKRNFSATFTHSAAHPVSYAVTQGSMQQGPEYNHLPRNNAEVKNGGNIFPFPYTSSWRGA
jgi:hypothetical protein